MYDETLKQCVLQSNLAVLSIGVIGGTVTLSVLMFAGIKLYNKHKNNKELDKVVVIDSVSAPETGKQL